jgi:hypothetical protein
MFSFLIEFGVSFGFESGFRVESVLADERSEDRGGECSRGLRAVEPLRDSGGSASGALLSTHIPSDENAKSDGRRHTIDVEDALHNISHVKGKKVMAKLANEHHVGLFLVLKRVQLALQQPFNIRNRSLSLHDVARCENLVLDVALLQPGRDSCKLRLRCLHDASDLINVQMLAVAWRTALRQETKKKKRNKTRNLLRGI